MLCAQPSAYRVGASGPPSSPKHGTVAVDERPVAARSGAESANVRHRRSEIVSYRRIARQIYHAELRAVAGCLEANGAFGRPHVANRAARAGKWLPPPSRFRLDRREVGGARSWSWCSSRTIRLELRDSRWTAMRRGHVVRLPLNTPRWCCPSSSGSFRLRETRSVQCPGRERSALKWRWAPTGIRRRWLPQARLRVAAHRARQTPSWSGNLPRA